MSQADPIFFARSALAAASRASENPKLRALHLGVASNAIATLEGELVELRRALAAQEAELVRLAAAAP